MMKNSQKLLFMAALVMTVGLVHTGAQAGGYLDRQTGELMISVGKGKYVPSHELLPETPPLMDGVADSVAAAGSPPLMTSAWEDDFFKDIETSVAVDKTVDDMSYLELHPDRLFTSEGEPKIYRDDGWRFLVQRMAMLDFAGGDKAANIEANRLNKLAAEGNEKAIHIIDEAKKMSDSMTVIDELFDDTGSIPFVIDDTPTDPNKETWELEVTYDDAAALFEKLKNRRGMKELKKRVEARKKLKKKKKKEKRDRCSP